jgi:hypothetical protein
VGEVSFGGDRCVPQLTRQCSGLTGDRGGVRGDLQPLTLAVRLTMGDG